MTGKCGLAVGAAKKSEKKLTFSRQPLHFLKSGAYNHAPKQPTSSLYANAAVRHQ
jgi:hypothetical protein